MAGSASEDRVVIVAPTGRDAEVLCLLLVRGGLDATVCPDLQGAVSALDVGAGALLLTEEVLRRDACLLAQWIARQPAWSDLPVLLLRSDLAQLDSADVGGGFGVYGNVCLLERPLRSETLLSALEAALRARRRQYQVRAYLIEREQAAAALRELNATLEERVAQAVAEQRQTEAALVQAQKMEALGRLTGGVAHDFNNLLTAVLGNLELLQTRLPPSDGTAQRLSDAVIRGIERGSRLTQQLLAFGRKQNLQLRAVDINEVIRGMGDLLTRALGTTVRVDTELAEDLWSAHVDENQLVLVILNLTINARDAMPLGGTVRIKTANVPTLNGHPGDLAPGDFVRVSVIDDGVGMNEEVLGKVFEPFFTTKQQGKGTGLGLSQVYGLTKQSGGTVAIESAVAQGTSAHVYLRRAERTATDGAIESADQRHAAATAPSDNVVLVTDDDAEVREVFVDYLAKLGFHAIEAESGPDALARFYDGERIDLLLADFAMPGMNGAELVRRAREVRPELPVMMVTGYVDEAQLGALDIEILRKPIRLADLGARVCELLGSPEQTTSIPAGASFAGRRALAD
jgi:signal transduction histidine kinase/CheY-like chemotaxis protein